MSSVMPRRLHALAASGLVLLALRSSSAGAQEAVTVTGHVSAASMPMRGASVRIAELDLGAITDADGRYSFIVPSARVRGQTVTITARYLRYRPESARIMLEGGSVVQDFELRSSTDADAQRANSRASDSTQQAGRVLPAMRDESSAATTTLLRRQTVTLASLRVDSTAFMDVAGTTDLPSALAGRLAGVEAQSATTPGGSSSLVVRGPHTIIGGAQPLYVVDGIPLDNSNVTTMAQASGRGGFDYGSAIGDLNLEDVGSVQLLRGPSAALQYGGRAANGVVLVTTRNARGLNGFDVSASQQLSFASPLRVPQYQNLYGQGLGGLFSFFNGKGGGLNDSVSQSWGPPLLGQPIPQASFTEAARAEVRAWLAHPDNVRDYFDRGHTLATNVAVQGANETNQFRLSLSDRSAKGLTPQNGLTRRAATLAGGTQPSPQLGLNGNLQLYSDDGDGRPGTGFDESNPVSVFSLMGRQVDVATLRAHLRDAANNQISWHYAGHNNPFFAPLQNDNRDSRTRWVAGGSATYALSSWLQGTARLGADHYHDTRSFAVASGWMGGFPDYFGRGDFSTGGSQAEDVTTTQTNAELFLRAAPRSASALSFALTAGGGYYGNSLHTVTTLVDQAAGPNGTVSQSWDGDGHTSFLLGAVDAFLDDYASLTLSARNESSSLLQGSSRSQLYPAVLASMDLARVSPTFTAGGAIDALRVRGGWSRSGNGASPTLLRQLGVSVATLAATQEQLVAPEITTGWEAGADAGLAGGRVQLDLAYYNERSENLLFPLATDFVRTGTVTNKGLEAQIAVVPIRSDKLEWNVGVSYGRNTNLVESLSANAASVPLGLVFGGVSVEARPGVALGAIVGTGYLRNAGGDLLLRDGHPLPDSAAGPRVLGVATPDWIGGIHTGLRLGGLELSVLFDVRRGGRIFSASNMAAGVAGVSAETSFRPDTGLLIAGTDVVTGAPNTVHVTTEDYYHSLAAIGEPWVYSASFVKLREARVSLAVPLYRIGVFHAQRLRVSLIGRNLALWSDAPNIDPETILSTSTFLRGAEMGQLPTARSMGVQFTLTP
jgi:TonB-dependent SusC/RagA subfamily outer membrane receptor